jgi:hypothetical protein
MSGRQETAKTLGNTGDTVFGTHTVAAALPAEDAIILAPSNP